MKINDVLIKMSDKEELWSYDKLNEKEWCKCRVMANELLEMLKENDIDQFRYV